MSSTEALVTSSHMAAELSRVLRPHRDLSAAWPSWSSDQPGAQTPCDLRICLVEVLALLAKHDLRAALEGMEAHPGDDTHVPEKQRSRRNQRRLPPDQLADLLVKYTEGTSVVALAEEYGVHRTTVMSHLERAGIPRRPCTRSMTDHDVAKAAAKYASGLSLIVVAEPFGVSARTIAREFRRAGVPIRPRLGSDG